jgi:hypothetical protein
MSVSHRCKEVAGLGIGRMEKAGVPSSGEKGKTPTLSKRIASMKESISSKSRSVSPGKPTMNEVLIAASGTMDLMRSTSILIPFDKGLLFIALRTVSVPCWSGISKYLQIRGSFATS